MKNLILLSITVLFIFSCALQVDSNPHGNVDNLLSTYSTDSTIAKINTAAPANSLTAITANIPVELTSLNSSARTISHNKKATHVGIFTVPGDSYWSANLEIKSLVPIHPDGSFELPYLPENSENSVIMMVNNEAANPLEIVVGFLTIPSTNGGALVEIPLHNASGNFELGAINAVSGRGDYNSEKSVQDIAASFTNTLEELESTARFGNGAKRVMNAFINNDDQGYSFKYYWHSDESIGSLKSSTSDPSQYRAYIGYAFELNLPYDASLFASIQDGSKAIYLYPPSSVNYTISNRESLFDEKTPLNSSGSMISAAVSSTSAGPGEPLIPTAIKVSFGDYIPSMFRDNFKLFTGSVPSDMWAIGYSAGPLAGAYDFSIIDPMRQDGKPAVFLPSVNISTDGSGDDIYSVSFSYFDKNGILQSAQISDVLNFVNGINILYGKNSKGSISTNINNIVGNSVVVNKVNYDWDTSSSNLDVLSISYNLYGVEHFFVFHK